MIAGDKGHDPLDDLVSRMQRTAQTMLGERLVSFDVPDLIPNVSLDIFNGNRSKKARRALPVNLWAVAARKLDLLNAAVD